MITDNVSFYSYKNTLTIFAVTAAYLLLSAFLIGFKTDQLVLAGIFNALYFLTGTTRKFILGFSIFIVYWILFDYMKAFPNYLFNNVHIVQLYNAEKSLFGFMMNGTTVTPNEYWLANHTTFLDIMSGLFYLCWIPVPLAFAAFLFYKDRRLFLHFAFTFVLVNMLGFVIYYIYPAAPPWYMQEFGQGFIAGTKGNTAGLHRFDVYFNVNIFTSLYAKSSNVFAAMPSLHSSYPLIVVYYGIREKLGWMNILFATVMVGIWFAAVYTSHHYVLDVLAGISCAIFGIFLFEKVLLKNVVFSRFVDKYNKKIK